MLLALAFFLSILFDAGQVLWRGRKRRFVWLLAFTHLDLRADADYVSRLRTYDKSTLEYALLQYRYRVELQDGCVSMLAGELRKIGFFPALAASAVAASTMLKNGSLTLLWGAVILAAGFSCMALFAQVQRERPQQVINLLEFAIDHVDVNAPEASIDGAR